MLLNTVRATHLTTWQSSALQKDDVKLKSICVGLFVSLYSLILALIQQSVVFISGNNFENQEDAVNVTADAFSIA